MGGTVTFESEENQGSTFSVTLKAKVPENCEDIMKSSLSGKRVLIVAFNCSQLLALDRIFRGLGCFTVISKQDKKFPSLNCTNAGFQSERFDFALIEIPNTSNRDYDQWADSLQDSGTVVIRFGSICGESNCECLNKPLKISALENSLNKIIQTKNEVPLPPDCIKSSNSSIKILLAEDNQINQKVIVKLLHFIGYYDITVVENGLEAVKAVTENQFDAVLMDVMMPEMGGIEATQILRKSLPDFLLPIFAITANAFEDDKKKCLEAGMNATITKPVNKTELSKCLSTVRKRCICDEMLPS